ncbi:unnamed protein product, partial [Ixodes hexagonus]
KHLGSERKKTAPQSVCGNVVERASGRYLTPDRMKPVEAVLPRLEERWSPNFASTPAPQHLQTEKICSKKALFLNLAERSSETSLEEVTNSILACDSFAFSKSCGQGESSTSGDDSGAPSDKDEKQNLKLQEATWNLSRGDAVPGKLSLLRGLRVSLVDLATEGSGDGGRKSQKSSLDLSRRDSSMKVVLRDLRVNLTDILAQTQAGCQIPRRIEGSPSEGIVRGAHRHFTRNRILLEIFSRRRPCNDGRRRELQFHEHKCHTERHVQHMAVGWHVFRSLLQPRRFGGDSLKGAAGTEGSNLQKAMISPELSCVVIPSLPQREVPSFYSRSSLVSRRTKVRPSTLRKSVLPPLAPDSFQVLLDLCHQEKVVRFEQALSSKWLRSCRKIGEGLYGEVFRMGAGSEASAVKIVPIGGSILVNSEQQKSVEQILPEVFISLVHFVQDTYHRALLKQWDLFDSRKGSENGRPDFFDASQMFVVFEFADGGESLECFKIKCAEEAQSIFLQVACALAVAEVALQYEHRDLHWGNILVTRTSEKGASYCLPDGKFHLDTCGVSVSLIDYSLSRLQKGGTVIFTDLSEDATLFEGTGDYQFEVYRLMKKHNGNDWKSFTPYTNILWLDYLLQKLLRVKSYRKTGVSQQLALGKLQKWANLILLCKSASEFVHNCGVTKCEQSVPRLRRKNIRV